MTSRRVTRWGVLALIPCLLMAGAAVMRWAAGPFWMGLNSDPSYIYLINSLYLLKGIPPIFVDHPGTPLQVLGVAVIRLTEPRLGTEELVRRVLLDPERFLFSIAGALWVWNAVTLWALGLQASRRLGSVFMGVGVQIPSLCFLFWRAFTNPGAVLPVAANVNSDTFLIGCLHLFFAMAFGESESGEKSDWGRVYRAALWGILGGLGVATKLSFLPVCVLALFLLRCGKEKGAFVFSLIVGFLIFTLPVWPRYSKMFAWVGHLIFKSGFHGGGKDFLISPWEYLNNFIWLVKTFPVLSVLGVISALRLGLMRRGKPPIAVSSRRRIIGACLVTALIHGLVVAKQPAVHYMIPWALCVGIPAMILLLDESLGVFLRRRAMRIGVVIGIVGAIVGKTALFAHALAQRQGENRAYVQALPQRFPDCLRVGYYRASSPYVALDFGDDCAGFKALAREMQSLYPGKIFFNRWTRQFHDFEKRVSLTALMEQYPCVMLFGDGMDFSDSFLVVQEVERVGDTQLVKIVDSTADEAIAHYLLSKRWVLQGDYTKAYFHALKAKEYGFPRMDAYLQSLQEKVKEGKR